MLYGAVTAVDAVRSAAAAAPPAAAAGGAAAAASGAPGAGAQPRRHHRRAAGHSRPPLAGTPPCPPRPSPALLRTQPLDHPGAITSVASFYHAHCSWADHKHQLHHPTNQFLSRTPHTTTTFDFEQEPTYGSHLQLCCARFDSKWTEDLALRKSILCRQKFQDIKKWFKLDWTDFDQKWVGRNSAKALKHCFWLTHHF